MIRGVRTGRASRPAAVLALMLTLVAMPASGPGALAQGLDARISEARQRQAGLQRSIDRQKRLLVDLRADQAMADRALDTTARSLDGINADQAAVRKEVAEATDALAKVRARRDGLVDELRHLDWTLSLLEQEIGDGDRELDQRRRLLGSRLAEAYRTQNTSLLEQVLADQSFSDVLSAANAYLSYGDQDAQLAQDIGRDQRALDSLRALTTATRYRTDRLRRDAQEAEGELRAQQDKLDVAREKLLKLEDRTQEIQAQQRSAFQRITGNAKEAKALVARQAAAERELDRRIADLVAEAKRRAEAAARAAAAAAAAAAREREKNQGGGGGGGALTEGRGSFSWPTSGVVTQEFGCTGFSWEPPRGNCAHFHDGIDISNAPGTPIRAPQSGVIAFAGWNPYDRGSDRSFIVVMGHAGGYESFFSHLQPRFAVRSGQSVSKGQVIGYMGNTGRSTGTHLHWEVSRGGSPVNPRDIV